VEATETEVEAGKAIGKDDETIQVAEECPWLKTSL